MPGYFYKSNHHVTLLRSNQFNSTLEKKNQYCNHISKTIPCNNFGIPNHQYITHTHHSINQTFKSRETTKTKVRILTIENKKTTFLTVLDDRGISTDNPTRKE
uniref:(northern house mosquito) hypothetical protein n=1 Tax=Culex pipiens TaxID=7175 RepID=A0A8D8BCZ9_CULPI